MLVHHADAGIERCARVAGRQRLAEDLDRSLVGDIVAEEDVHQRRLAGAVLAKQRDDLAARELEGDRIVGDQRAEALGDAGEAEDGCERSMAGRRVDEAALLPVAGRRWPSEARSRGSASFQPDATPHPATCGPTSPRKGRGKRR